MTQSSSGPGNTHPFIVWLRATRPEFERRQWALRPLEQRISAALKAAGMDYAHADRTGYSTSTITPIDPDPGEDGRDYIEIVHVDWPWADHRPPCARYVAALEGAGIRVEITEDPAWEKDGTIYAPYPRIKVYADANP